MPARLTKLRPLKDDCTQRYVTIFTGIVASRRRGTSVPLGLLQHVTLLGWEHISLTGDYIRGSKIAVSLNSDSGY